MLLQILKSLIFSALQVFGSTSSIYFGWKAKHVETASDRRCQCHPAQFATVATISIIVALTAAAVSAHWLDIAIRRPLTTAVAHYPDAALT